MIYSASNIAWPAEHRLQAYDMLAQQEFGGLEIAPALFFFAAEDPFVPNKVECDRALGEIAESGLSLVSMQSLLFGVGGAELFGDVAALQKLETGMHRAIRLAGRLGIPNLVFGSPKQRAIPKGMGTQGAFDKALEVFCRLGDMAHAEGTVIAIESNPVVYGTNFLTHGEDALDFVRQADHLAIRFILDIGAMHINGAFDKTPTLIAKAAPMLSHVHFSEAQLAPAPADTAQAVTIIGALQEIGYDRAVSIEMKAAPETPIDVVAAAVDRLGHARKRVAYNGGWDER